jgi:hypothetical protein
MQTAVTEIPSESSSRPKWLLWLGIVVVAAVAVLYGIFA